MEKEQFGSDLREFLKGLLKLDTNENQSSKEKSSIDTRPDPLFYRDLPSSLNQNLPEKPKAKEIVLMPNFPATLDSGKLLLGVQKDNSVYTLDLESGKFEIVCKLLNTPMLLWRALPFNEDIIICTLSGTRWPENPLNVAFGIGGAVLWIDHKKGNCVEIPGTEDMVDPCDIIKISDEEIILADFNGFGGTGTIYRLNVYTGKKSIIATEGYLKDPVAITLHRESGDLYIANSIMSYDPHIGPGGDKIKETGAIIKVNINDKSGIQKLIYDESDIPRGEIDTLVIDSSNTHLMFTRNDWPTQEYSALVKLDISQAVGTKSKNFGKAVTEIRSLEELIDAPNNLKKKNYLSMFSRGGSSASGGGRMKKEDDANIKNSQPIEVTHFADSYNNILVEYDITNQKVNRSYNLDPLLGSYIGIANPFDSVESLYLITL